MEYPESYNIESGDKIIIEYIETMYNTSARKHKKKKGVFIKAYKTYLQFYDKYNIRTSIMNQDIIKIERIRD